jgi:sugar phosphate isomerase/epimerase
MGIWGNTNLRDRFNINGFGEDVSVIDRIRQVGEIEGIDGIELHLPTEINDTNASEIEKVLDDCNLQIVQLCGHTWTEKQYKFGALANADERIRCNAINRVKAALDMGARFDVPISVLWPATDGNDFPMQTDYISLYDRYLDSVRQIMEYLHQNDYSTKICVEPKPFEPRSYIMMGTTAQALCVVNEINDPNFGINLDIGHSLIARENIEDQLSLIARYGKLYHTHFDDNDMQADIDLPPGTISFERLVSIIYILDAMGYDDWFGLDLFPYRDDPVEFMKLSVENLRLAQSVVALMNENGARELRVAGTQGTEMSRLLRDSIREAK